MLSKEERSNKISSYIGFAKREGKLFVGEKLLEKLSKHKIRVLVLAKEGNEKVKNDLLSLASKDKDCKTISLPQEEISRYSGYTKLNALGIQDRNLASALVKVSRDEKTSQHDDKEENT